MPEQFDPFNDLRAHLAREESCKSHPELRRSESIEEAELWRRTVENCSPTKRRAHLRWLCRNDLYFLLVFMLHRWHIIGDREPFDPHENDALSDARHRDRDQRKAQWCWSRCKEYQDDPWNKLDLWSREHFKSEIITFGGNIKSILEDPNETVGIFSHTRPIAKGFLGQIKTEFENNDELKELFNDVLYGNPELQAPHWGADIGLYVKRKTNRKEATVEAWGLVDGQPTSKRFTILSYDDVVSRKEITDTMIPRTTEEFQNSLLLTASDPVRFRYAATFQEIGDTTQQLIDRGFAARVRPGVTDDNRSLCLSDEKVAWFKDSLSPKVFALQILLNQKDAKGQHQLGFAPDWVEYYSRRTVSINSLIKYILVDPAGNSKETNSHFAMGVIGLSPDRRYKWLDAVYDKLNLDERTEALRQMCITYQPKIVFYEKQAMQSDIEHIRGKMRQDLWEYEIIPVGTNKLTKDQRIEMLIPVFKGHQFHLPEEGIKYTPQHPDGNYGQANKFQGDIDIIKVFIEREFGKWPVTEFKDLLDMLAWLVFPEVAQRLYWPRPYGDKGTESGPWGSTSAGGGGSWMSD